MDFLFLWLRLPYSFAENTVIISKTSLASVVSKLSVSQQF